MAAGQERIAQQHRSTATQRGDHQAQRILARHRIGRAVIDLPDPDDDGALLVDLRSLADLKGQSVVSSGAFDNFLSACQGPSLEQLAQVGVDCSKISPSFEGALIMIQMGTAMSIVPCLSTAVIPGIVKVPLLDFPPVTVEIAAMRHAPRLEVQSFIEIAKQKYAHPHDPLLMETLI